MLLEGSPHLVEILEHLGFGAGLLAGAAHVVAGPDHWVAVTPLSIAQPERAVRIGIRWGIGHAVGIIILGVIGLLLKDMLSLDPISSVAEGLVGVVLVISGFWALDRSRKLVIHSHPHHHQAVEQQEKERADAHEHVHIHVGETAHDSEVAHRKHSHAAFGFGMLHGIAGASQLWALIPIIILPTGEAISYLVAFIVSSILAMGGFTYAVGRWASKGQAQLGFAFKFVGWGSIILGAYWAGLATMGA